MTESEIETTELVSEEETALGLPSRSETHRKKKASASWRFSLLWFKCLLSVFIILILLVITHPYWSSWVENNKWQNEEPVSYIEEISIQ
ncbi:hypothetical protein GCM10010954_04480 [Halobacillus andaensis]|uniref:Uncharacterized protein n=1 Tax=Halobacillus andaensis TaxID=1176239 RepID=A0A917ESJ2_HALAA|nr:hypothetical protein [Halobacillus andaensis]MBP2003238.1 hypothetical protein [Halobacillus andaensis]GGF09148.1 hypothetical protein GCM10010954_04480 [Halobacillus andaensis]